MTQIDPFTAEAIQGNIYKEHGPSIPSIECRDLDGRVWIGFRGVGVPSSCRNHGC